MAIGKLKIKGVNTLRVIVNPLPSFTIEAHFSTLETQNNDGEYLEWGTSITSISNFTPTTLISNFEFGSMIVDFIQPTSNRSYEMDTTLFNIDEYYRFESILYEPNRNRGASFDGQPLNTFVFKYNGIIESNELLPDNTLVSPSEIRGEAIDPKNPGNQTYLEFQPYRWSMTNANWELTPSTITTFNRRAFASFVASSKTQI